MEKSLYRVFWNETPKITKGHESIALSFNYVETFCFLQDNGFYRNPENRKSFIRVDEFGEVHDSSIDEIRNFIKDYLRKIERLDVLDMIMRGGPQYLSDNKLSFLDFYIHKRP